jgi:hypothetical protein
MLLEHQSLSTPPEFAMPAPNQHSLSEVRRLLLLGHRADACEAAMRANLWDHALLIASRLGTNWFNDVLARYAALSLSFF